MSELGELFSAWKKGKHIKKQSNSASSLEILREHKINFKCLSIDHLRVDDYDFWPSTGLFIHMKSKKRGRGVFNLIKKLNKGGE